jgi:hypothetical protein
MEMRNKEKLLEKMTGWSWKHGALGFRANDREGQLCAKPNVTCQPR